jgi:hypothetical protein
MHVTRHSLLVLSFDLDAGVSNITLVASDQVMVTAFCFMRVVVSVEVLVLLQVVGAVVMIIVFAMLSSS